MNLTNFLKQTEAATESCSAAQLKSFIHDIARALPEHGREDFLRKLKAAGKESTKTSDKDKIQETAFEEMYKRVRDNLKRIDS